MFSLGIPVRNEEKNIKAVIESALSQSLTPEEVLVCVNGTKDRTKDILKKYAEKDARLIVLESEPGKANAWNKIVSETRNQTMCFCDGDISFGDKYCFEKLISEMERRRLTMLGASIIQLPSKRVKPYKLRIPSGQLYAIDLKKLGFSNIPNNTINEDLFLALNSNPDFDVIDEIFFYSKKPNIFDIARTQLRILRGIKQIIDLGMEKELVNMLKTRGYPEWKIKLVLRLAKLINVGEKDYIWLEPLSTKGEIKTISQ